MTNDVGIDAGAVDDIWNEVLTGATHNVTDSSGARLRNLVEWGDYAGGAIWIDTVNGSAGTTDYESGTVFNPVNGINDANTLATSLGITRFAVAPGFAAAQVDPKRALTERNEGVEVLAQPPAEEGAAELLGELRETDRVHPPPSFRRVSARSAGRPSRLTRLFSSW